MCSTHTAQCAARRRIDWLTWLSAAWGAQRETLDRNGYDDDDVGAGGDDDVGGGGGDDDDDGGGGGDGGGNNETGDKIGCIMWDLATISFSLAMVTML